MQNITIAGRVGRDAELRRTQGGDPVCSFTVAVDYRNGRDKATNWWRVSLWGKRGEALALYLLKGVSVTVSGEFSLGEYEGKPQLNIRANDIALQGGRSEGGQAQRVPDGSRGAPPPRDDLDEDSIPFLSMNSIS
ncbi:MAG: single-stranded DNA-binding protein [Novosphingobium sp.]|uniref:single-stranded DNA-binding protein n=1 Tax=Novosphingobium sp. TaxID=1874826 RepID=UPI00301B43C5